MNFQQQLDIQTDSESAAAAALPGDGIARFFSTRYSFLIRVRRNYHRRFSSNNLSLHCCCSNNTSPHSSSPNRPHYNTITITSNIFNNRLTSLYCSSNSPTTPPLSTPTTKPTTTRRSTHLRERETIPQNSKTQRSTRSLMAKIKPGLVGKQTTPYAHESRHKHAMRRPRGPGGRFLSAAELAALKEVEASGSE
ncbi:hypothetical protein BCR33DRAFT_715449 [Rhizoclosmatium globosum]|uniref:Transcriptional activator HAP2 n=1 Tax=Rhizoclosmatium globosum TaxID=329046 RepID=A0A1Y2CH04_9FUNG|nr:hypothetical protein BCR33DRAFT_715449 [Rhizoclosmatium globosum]|eukprot:ORY46330.1 hypothetical protein BCR33DRAFT_715449 [Rhizoclosmatium globosum]